MKAGKIFFSGKVSQRASGLLRFLKGHLFLVIVLWVLIIPFCLAPLNKNILEIPTRLSWVGYGGFCTDWVYARWHEVHSNEELKVDGDAWQWLGYAAKHGMVTGSVPKNGSVAVWGSDVGGGTGHVAFVEQVYSPNSFKVTEMNWSCGRWCKDTRDVTMYSDIHFIYSVFVAPTVTQCNEHDRCRGSGLAVYFIERGKKRLIPNPETLDYLDNEFGGNIKDVSDSILNGYPIGRGVPSITWSDMADYVLIKTSSDNAIFLMSHGFKRYLFNFDQIDSGDGDFYYPSDIRVISQTEFNSIPFGPALYLNGQLARGSSSLAVYLMDRNKKRLVPNLETLQSRGFKPEVIHDIPQGAVDTMATGRGVPSITWSNTADGILIRGVSKDWTYVMKAGQKRYLFTYDQIDPNDGDFYYSSDVRVLTDAEVNQISTGTPMVWNEQLLRPIGTLDVYVVECNKKRHLPNLQTLQSRNLQAKNIIDIDQGIVDMIPSGRVVPDINWLNTHDNILLQKKGSSDIWLMKGGKRQTLSSFDNIDPDDGDFYYPSDVRTVNSLADIPIQPLDLHLALILSRAYWASYADYQAHKLSVDFTIRNSSDNDAHEVVLTASNNSQGVSNLTSLPLNVGDILKDADKQITLTYNVQPGIHNFRVKLAATAKDANTYLHTYP